jgi:hypothetical protein
VIGGWLVKVIVGIALLGFAVVELGSPFVARAQADDAAHEIANEASFQLGKNFSEETLQSSCTMEADKHDVSITTCTYDQPTNMVHVTVTKEARSFLLAKFDATKDWYIVDASAEAEKR